MSFFIYLDLKPSHLLTYSGHYLPSFLLYKMILEDLRSEEYICWAFI